MRNMKAPAVIALFVTVFHPARAGAHEFWIEPSSWEPAPGEEVLLHLRAGEFFDGEEIAYDRGHAVEFRHVWAGGEETLAGEEGVSPAGWMTPRVAGCQLITYRSSATEITLPAETFNAYLASEGLREPLETRRTRGELGREGRERFSRYCKAVVMAKEPSEREHSRERSDAPWSRILGHRLEIVPEVDPADGALGGAFRARVLFEGQPLAGALVQAFPGPLRAETDRDGRIRFDLPHGGAWLVSVVHMVPCASCGRSDWESAWASLTFFRTEIQSTSASRTR